MFINVLKEILYAKHNNAGTGIAMPYINKLMSEPKRIFREIINNKKTIKKITRGESKWHRKLLINRAENNNKLEIAIIVVEEIIFISGIKIAYWYRNKATKSVFL